MKGKPYSDLPSDIQKAIESYYHGYDAEVDENVLWEHSTLPLWRVAQYVWEDPAIKGEHASFQDYHRWWKSGRNWHRSWMRLNPDSILPIILNGRPGSPYDPDIGAILDGWHRFHWYVDHWGPQKKIPVTWATGRKRLSTP